MNISKLLRFSGKIAYASLLIVLIGNSFSTPARSEPLPNGRLEEGGLAINPFLLEESMEKGETLERSITIYNTLDQTLPLDISINDFEPVGKDGQVRFLPPDKETTTQFSLVNWIKIKQQPNFELAAHGQTSITFTITPPLDAENGSHFGGLLFSYKTAREPGSSTTVVKKIGAVIIVKLGKANGSGEAREFKTVKKTFQTPTVVFTTLFENTGNVHISPKGKIEIYNWYGKLAGLSYINENAQNILPKTSREFTSTFHNSWMLGKYHASATIYFGNPKLEKRVETTFWVIPWLQLKIFSVGAVILVFLIYMSIKRYNAWIIKKSERSST